MISCYNKPKTIGDAISLKSADLKAVYLAGGTDVIISCRNKPDDEFHIINLDALDQLRGIQRVPFLKLGALTTFSQVLQSTIPGTEIELLKEAASQVAATQIRNRATIGGNICNGNPSADSLPVLLLLNTQVVCEDTCGEFKLPLSQFLAEKRKLRPETILKYIQLESLPTGSGAAFAKVGRRKRMAISRINAAAMLQPHNGVIHEARLCLGAVYPISHRLSVVEEYLEGKPFTTKVLENAADLAYREVEPFVRGRGSAEYKLPVIHDLVVRLLTTCYERAGGHIL